MEIAAFLLREHNEFNHFRFVFETRGEQKTVIPVTAVSIHLAGTGSLVQIIIT